MVARRAAMIISDIFNSPDNKFVLLPDGIKFPPIEKEWEKKGHSFEEARMHPGNVGIMAGNGHIGFDQDELSAFVGLELPPTQTWETRPGRLGMRFSCHDRMSDVLAAYDKSADQAQIKLYKNGQPVGEVKLERTYQVIPPSWKMLEDGITKVDYKMLQEVAPTEISLKKFLADLKILGISFSKNPRLETNAKRLESLITGSKQQKVSRDDGHSKRYAQPALEGEVQKVRNARRGERNDQLLKSAATLAEFVPVGLLTEAEIRNALERVAEDDEPEKIPKTIESGLRRGQRKARKIPEPDVPFIKLKSKGVIQGSEARFRPPLEKPIVVITEPETKVTLVSKTKNNQGNVEWLIEIHSHDLKYVREYKDWVRWDGIKWKRDETAITRALADVVKILYDIARCTDDDEERGKAARFASSCGNNAVYMATAQLASRNKNFSVSLLEFDQNDFELNLLNGVLDLDTSELRPHSHLDRFMKCVGYGYDKSAACPKWLRFLDEIYGGDKDLIGYLQRVVGRCLTGSNSDKAFFFLFGPDGDNGKSKVLEILRALLGEYAYHAAFSTFLKSRNEKGVRDDLAPFYGMRLVTSSEPDEGKLFELNTIKGITGGDPITCRELYGKMFSFIPTCKLFFAANNQPAITERSNAAWDRVRVIPHKVSIPKEKQDPMLGDKLKKELPGILNWALAGLKEYSRLGNLADPESVRLAVKEYRLDNDTVRQFIDEVCVFKDTMQILGPDLYDSYKEFCYDTGKRPLGLNKFTSAMIGATALRGVTRKRTPYGWMWYSIHAPEARHRYGRGL
jgi:P4 family phage/plasmid primase-like protien